MAERKWTPAQRNAIDADSGTVLVSAAAGSGKTSVLVERIVRKITDAENAVAPESLLVVTFTNAAAAEMRGRIFRRVSEKIAEEPQRRSEYILLLSRLSEMQVCTMDSFCMNLVKENCHLAGIAADFRILDGAEEKKLKNKVASEICGLRFRDNGETFIPLAEMFDNGKSDKALIGTIISLSDYSMSEPVPDEWLQGVADHFIHSSAADSVWGRCISENVLFLLSYCSELCDGALADIGEDPELEEKLIEMFTLDRQVIDNCTAAVKNGSWDEKLSALEGALNNIKAMTFRGVPKAYSKNPSKLSAQAKRNEYKEVLEKAVNMMCCTEQENAEDVVALSGIARELIATVRQYNSALLEAKKEMAAFSFSDISHFALSLLYDGNAADGKTALAGELTDSLSEILIDEYQDTNRAQDTLFRTLSKNGKNMFFVGDVKQSIYRFRLASPEIFIEKCDRFPYYDGTADESKIILSENFRSRKGILDGVNFVFSSLMSRECGEIEYNEDERLNYPASSAETLTEDVFYTVIEADGEDAEAVEARYIAGVIKDKLKSCTVSSGGSERPAAPSDFCILLRSKSGTLPHFVKELKKAGLPVASEAAEAFFETPEIKMMMAFLKVIDNPVRDVELLAVLMSPFFGFSADDAAELRIRYGRKGSLYSAVVKAAGNGDAKCERVVRKLSFFKKLSACLSADMLIREIYSDSSLIYIASAMPDGSGRAANLNRLLEMAEEGREYRSSLGSFLRYADTVRENSSDAGNAAGGDGVRIMSMHKSKGLEFPFVFIAGTTKQFNKQDLRSSLVVSHNYGVGIKRREKEDIKHYDTLSFAAVRADTENNSMSEELRIYYVAMTRAKQELHIVTALEKAREKLENTEYLLSNLKRIPAYKVRYAVSPSVWLMMCFLRHPDGRAIRFVTPDRISPRGEVNIGYIEALKADEEEKTVLPPLPDEKITEAIRKNAEFDYKWKAVSSALSKHTASSLREEHFDPVNFGKSVPAFMYSGKMSPSDIGTATHRFLQFCDFDACRHSVNEELVRLTVNGRLTEKQAQTVDVQSITAFINSDIMERIDRSAAVYREKQFTVSKYICELDSSIPSEFSEEKTVVIGKIDLLFTEDNGAVIVDYKTDNVSDVNILSERYRDQMLLYIDAVEKSMGLKVRECILYSLKLRDSVSLKF